MLELLFVIAIEREFGLLPWLWTGVVVIVLQVQVCTFPSHANSMRQLVNT